MDNLVYTNLETEIIRELNFFILETRQTKLIGNTAWTNGIKRRLGNLGASKGLSVCTSGFRGEFESEWLYDLIWYKEEGTGPEARIIDVPLVVECEWNMHFSHIKYDFEKLLGSNARHRLMICYAHDKSKEGLRKYFREAVDRFLLSKEGDRFLIAILDYKEELFDFELIVKHVEMPQKIT